MDSAAAAPASAPASLRRGAGAQRAAAGGGDGTRGGDRRGGTADRDGRNRLGNGRVRDRAEHARGTTTEPAHRKAARCVWALLLARIYEVLPLVSPKCGGDLRIIACLNDGPLIREILGHLGDPTSAPTLLGCVEFRILCQLPTRSVERVPDDQAGD